MATPSHATTGSVGSTLSNESLESIYSTISMDCGAIHNEYAAFDSDMLVNEALTSIIEKTTFTEPLRGGVLPKELLRHMLLDAPHPLGQRYIALLLYVAASKGHLYVAHLASVLLDHLLFPGQSRFLTGSFPLICAQYWRKWPMLMSRCPVRATHLLLMIRRPSLNQQIGIHKASCARQYAFHSFPLVDTF